MDRRNFIKFFGLAPFAGLLGVIHPPKKPDCSPIIPAYYAKAPIGVMHCHQLSIEQPNNLGVVLRNKFIDLRNTMAEFEQYCDIKLNIHEKSIIYPNGSKILFRHGKELNCLWNLNLGWFLIDHPEEFTFAECERAEQLLRCRLRRKYA